MYKPSEGAKVTLTVEIGNGTVFTGATNSEGVFTARYKVANRTAIGEYNIHAKVEKENFVLDVVFLSSVPLSGPLFAQIFIDHLTNSHSCRYDGIHPFILRDGTLNHLGFSLFFGLL